jgi:hypothetical protein
MELDLVLEYTFVKVAGHSDVKGAAAARNDVCEIATFVHGEFRAR